MIWNATPELEQETSPIVAQVLHEIDTFCDGPHRLDRDTVYELGLAVEEYLSDRNPDETVAARDVTLLASCALASIGETVAARRLVILGSGLVKPTRWEVTGQDSVWILDLKEIAPKQQPCLEMFFLKCLNLVFDSIADVWDTTGGKGTLGLRHVCASACVLLGETGSRKEVVAITSEIKGFCRDKLRQLARHRGWTTVPDVLNLDI